MSATSIEWTDATWNPLAGCTPISPGCTHCYAATMARRLAAMGQAKYVGTAERRGKVDVFTGEINLDHDSLAIPLRWKKPRMVFVNSMSDLFHEAVPFEFVDKVFAVMNATALRLNPPRVERWHTYQVLTKRPERMAEYLESRRPEHYKPGNHPLFAAGRGGGGPLRGHGEAVMNAGAIMVWPLTNVWLGTSTEDQERADERIPWLLKCPAAVRFLSCEPLLGPIDLGAAYRKFIDQQRFVTSSTFEGQINECPHCDAGENGADHDFNCPYCYGTCFTRGIDWVIAGGESGHGARPVHPTWVRGLRDQCNAAGVAFFFKQWGEWMGGLSVGRDDGNFVEGQDGRVYLEATFKDHEFHQWDGPRNHEEPVSLRLGKKAAGRLLDGREWNEMPQVAHV